MSNPIKKIREKLGFTQKDIAKVIKTSQPTISQIESKDFLKTKSMAYLKFLVDNGIDINTFFK